MSYDEWHPGDPIGLENDIGAPEVPYMSYCPKRREKEEDYGPTPKRLKKKRRNPKQGICLMNHWNCTGKAGMWRHLF